MCPTPSRPSGFRNAPLVLTLLLCAGSAPAALGASAVSRIEPGLAVAARLAPEESFSVWVSFADKGEEGPADRAARLAAAEASLTPRARARRTRAGVWPLVDERDLPVSASHLAALAAKGAPPLAVSRWLNEAAVRVPGRRLEEIAGLPFVAGLRPVERARVSIGPAREALPASVWKRATGARSTAIDYGDLLGPLAQIGIPPLHDAGFTGAGVLVAVLDAGFNYFTKHEALRDLVVPAERQRDFVRGVYDVQDTTNFGMVHGTWVLGCLAGQKAGKYVGAAFQADYALARTEVVESETAVEMIRWGLAAEWADSLGADLISSSLSYSTFDGGVPSYTYADMDGKTTTISRLAQIAASKGILIVNAVGNEGQGSWRYLMAPSDVHGDSVIAVGAVDAGGVPAAFSSYGPSADGRVKPDLTAWGVATPLVATTGAPDAYNARSGTSFSTPLVAGLAACILQARPAWTPRQVAVALRTTASRAASPNDRVGYGIPYGPAALSWAPLVPAPGSSLALEVRGPHPVALSRAPARFRIGLASGSCPDRPGVLEVRDVMGRLVGRPWSGMLLCGVDVDVTWDGLDRKGIRCGAGLYVVELRAGNDRVSRRLVCLP